MTSTRRTTGGLSNWHQQSFASGGRGHETGLWTQADKDLAGWPLTRAIDVILTVLKGRNQCAGARYDSPATVGVLADHQANTPVMDCFGEVGVEREKEGS